MLGKLWSYDLNLSKDFILQLIIFFFLKLMFVLLQWICFVLYVYFFSSNIVRTSFHGLKSHESWIHEQDFSFHGTSICQDVFRLLMLKLIKF